MAALSAPALPMNEPDEGDDAFVQSSEVDSNATFGHETSSASSDEEGGV